MSFTPIPTDTNKLVNSKTAAIYGAFFMEGLHDCSAGYDVILEKWDQGCIELIDAVCGYAEPLYRIVNHTVFLYDDSVSWPGVFVYEVCSPFGAWCGNSVLETGELPPDAECKEWLHKAVTVFFKQGVPA